jgi:hypothetical protein
MTNKQYNLLVKNFAKCETVSELSKITNISEGELKFYIKELINKAKNTELEGKYQNDISSSLDYIEEVKDIKKAEYFNYSIDDSLPCINVFFIDEQNRERLAELNWDKEGPGMVYYSNFCQKAKEDLIQNINNFYEYKKGEKENEK